MATVNPLASAKMESPRSSASSTAVTPSLPIRQDSAFFEEQFGTGGQETHLSSSTPSTSFDVVMHKRLQGVFNQPPHTVRTMEDRQLVDQVTLALHQAAETALLRLDLVQSPLVTVPVRDVEFQRYTSEFLLHIKAARDAFLKVYHLK